MFAPLNLEGKVAVVIGGTSGMGRAISVGLAEAGADVVACSRRRDAAETTALESKAADGDRCRRADVADRKALIAAREAVLAGIGHIDILINCAGIIKRTPALEIPEEEWDSILETNLTALCALARCLRPQ